MPDHGCPAGIPAGILPWRPESCSRGPTDESGTLQMEGIGVRLQTTVFSGSEQWYLLRLRVLGAWWCLGSSALKPYLLLQYSPAPPVDVHVVPV